MKIVTEWTLAELIGLANLKLQDEGFEALTEPEVTGILDTAVQHVLVRIAVARAEPAKEETPPAPSPAKSRRAKRALSELSPAQRAHIQKMNEAKAANKAAKTNGNGHGPISNTVEVVAPTEGPFQS